MSKRIIMVWVVGVVILALLVGCQGRALSSSETGAVGEDRSADVRYDTTAVQIILNGDSITVEGDGVIVDGSRATIVSAGAYSISGTLTDGQIVVNTEDEDAVQLILNGAAINSSTGAPIYVENAEEAVIVLQDGTENTISDGTTYVFPSADVDEPDAAIFSFSDLTIAGSGSLAVAGNYRDGIASQDGLVIAGGNITVNAADDGIRGRDYLLIEAGNISVNAQGDGLKASNDEDTTLGYITVQSGTIAVNAGGDAISAETNVLISDGVFTLSAGGGSSGFVDDTASAKGIKAGVRVQIDGGTFTIDTADDAINANDSVVINGGSYTISSGDDGMHADAALEVNGGDINITASYEGIESAVITLNAGTIHIVASDDGINVAGGNDGSGMMAGPGRGGRQGQGGGFGQDAFAATGSYFLYINGGYIAVDAYGDGVDVNGSIVMTNGVVLVNGPTENMNGALDYDGGFNISGGFFVAAGSAGMAQAPDQTSTQASVLINLDSMQQAGTLIRIQTADGQDIVTFAPTKAYQSIVISSPELLTGSTLDIYVGGSSSGTVQDSLYQEGGYTPGTQYTSLTLSGVITQVGGGGFGGPRR